MKFSTSSIFAVLALLAVAAKAEPDVITLSGSGTTNPSKCFWKIMDHFRERCRTPLWMSYRAIGSGNGIKEFIGVNNTGDFTYKSYNDFGAGDIPIPSAQYNALKLASPDTTIYHLPFVMGAISIFHSIPNVPDGPLGLNLTSCTLARIFSRKIKNWDDTEILVRNPGLLKALGGKKLPIKVAHRQNGSSSTASITQYLNEGCPTEWPESSVGKLIKWDAETTGVEGSGQMTTAIRDNDGAIGYLDAGHGHSENLVEIELENKNGKFLSSKYAMMNGGISAAAESLPADLDLSMDFDNINYLNKPGDYTWPIVAMSYIYVRKDLNDVTSDIHTQALLKAFLLAIYDKNIISECDEYGFTRIPDSVRNKGIDVINGLELAATAPTFIFEDASTKLYDGQDNFVISRKIRRYNDVVRGTQEADVQDLIKRATQTESTVSALDSAVTRMTGQPISVVAPTGRVFTDDDYNKLMAALVLGTISFCLW
eukprot:CAMPEP_0197824842 /NCGR_PEP_ID=MMETSP1437-20131217/2049_1 /TAXON_ID=49252 ORGANISM="Eucampia antarctica, Strain CCMP1452" /NCGR_SAMPLE_ID=MMETSP1437 /ASSEMBLY_ACC=CAM_ASM_001096 /LENGTH=482 /DNA_ID=CAMNT_0043424635 /DNA_START=118 /DNA_END=1563 /DNA_ORIENTATION=+